MELKQTIEACPVPVYRLHGGRPVLEALASSDWQARVVLNPAAVLIEDRAELIWLADRWGLPQESREILLAAGGVVVMLYRAQGARSGPWNVAPSSIGLALFTPEMEFVWRHPQPVIAPGAWFDRLGVEDPRCTRVGDLFYLFYTGFTARRKGSLEAVGEVRILWATTRDFLIWDVKGPLKGDLNRVPNKNAALFPEPVDGRWYLLHRPMRGPDAMSIHLASAERPEGPWRSEGVLMRSYHYAAFASSWVGAGGPPIALGNGRFLMIYHIGHYVTPDRRRREYHLGAALLDLRAAPAERVRARIEPLLRPEGEGEQVGDPELGVDNVVFSCANYVWRGQLIIPYAGADSRIFAASVPLEALVHALEARARGAL
nr:MAG: glycosidase [Bacteroidota bacterium]